MKKPVVVTVVVQDLRKLPSQGRDLSSLLLPMDLTSDPA